MKQLSTRQRIRKGMVILAFLTFPVTMNFLSPYVIIDGAMQGIASGSLVMFGLLFAASLFLGRAWCGWVCPGGGMQEMVEPVNLKPVNGWRVDWIKWLIWLPWISIIAWLFVRARGIQRVDFLHLTESGFSVDEPVKYITYYGVVLLFVGLAAFAGRRAGCHTICWMAPFLMIGRWLRNRLGLPALELRANAAACSGCQACTRNCPMSLDVHAMVQAQRMEHPECILCGTCVDGCAKQVIRYRFGVPQNQ